MVNIHLKEKNNMKIDKLTKPLKVSEFVEKLIGVKLTGTGEPMFEHCTSCKAVRTKGRCFNKECKYYDKTI